MYRDDKIRAEMAIQQLHDDDMAAKTGLTRQTIALLRKGEAKDVKLSTLDAVARALGKETPWLVEPRREPEVARA